MSWPTHRPISLPGSRRFARRPDAQSDLQEADADLVRRPSIRRIYITGGPGSGKSTLARRIGEALDIAVYELDAVAYEGPEFTERPLADRLEDVDAISRSDEWVVEGIHLQWTDRLLDEADLIVWLDQVSWLHAAFRILTRFTVLAAAEARARTGVMKFMRLRDYRRHLRQLLQVLMRSREYYRGSGAGRRYPATREAAEQRLHRHAPKTVRCRSDEQITNVLTALVASYRAGEP